MPKKKTKMDNNISSDEAISYAEELETKNRELQVEIAERIRAEEELRKLTRAIEQSQSTVMITDVNGHIEYINPKFTQLTGYTPEEVIGKNPRLLKPDHIPSEAYRKMWETITSGNEWRGEFCNKKKNGDLYWEFASISPVRNHLGAITHFIAVKEDITDRKVTEEKLRKLTQAIEQSPSTVLITDSRGCIEYVNRKFTQLTGYTAEEVVGKYPRILKPDNIPSDEYKKLWETISSGKEWRGEFRNKKKNGDLYWEFASIYPVKNNMGAITHFIAVKEDITAQKLAEENLRKLTRAIEQSPSTVLITDANGCIEYVNPKFTELTGYTSEEVIGKNPRILKPDNISSDIYKKMWEAISTGEEWRGEFCNKKKNGELYWEFASISPVKNDEGVITHYIAVKEDITERKRAEQERIKHIKELEDIMSYSTIMNEEVREESVFKHLSNSLQEQFNPDLIIVSMIDKEKNILYVPLINPDMPVNEMIKDEVLVNPSLCSVLRTGESHIVEDINSHSLCECLKCTIEKGGYICLPMATKGNVAGVVVMAKRDFTPWQDEKIRRLMANYVGLTALALQRLELLEIAKHTTIADSLTGLYNKRFFHEILGKQIVLAKRRNEQVSLLVVGVDQFLDIYNTYGQAVVDQVLLHMTRILSDAFSEADIIARYGNEEFAVIMPNTFINRALVKADGIRRYIESVDFEDIVEGQALQLTVSIGAVSYPDHGTDPDDLLALVDEIYHRSKNEGRNRIAAP